MAPSSTLLLRDVVLALQAFSEEVEVQPFWARMTAAAKLLLSAAPKNTDSRGNRALEIMQGLPAETAATHAGMHVMIRAIFVTWHQVGCCNRTSQVNMVD